MMKTLRKITLLSLSLMLTSALAISTVLPAMLGYFKQYPTEKVEILITVPSFAITAMIILNTWISKYLKERHMIVLGLLIMSVSGIVPVFTKIYIVILASRILLGLGIGMINAKAISVFSEYYEGNEKDTLLGYRGSAEVLGNAVMTLVAGRLLLINWNYAFLVYALGFVILLMYLIFIPDVKESGKTEKTENNYSVNFTRSNVITIILYTLLAGILVCINCSNSMRIPMLVLERKFGTESEASIVLSVLMITGIVAGIFFGKLSELCKENLSGYSLIFLGIGIGIIAFSVNTIMLVIGAIVTGFFYTISLTCVFSGISDKMSKNIVNMATSVVLVGCNLGGAFSPMVLKIISKINTDTEMPFLVYMGIVMIVGCIVLINIFAQKRISHRRGGESERTC